MTNPLQIGLIGFSHGRQMDYGRALAAYQDARPVAVAEAPDAPRDPRDRAQALAREWDVPLYDDVEAMLGSHCIEAVSIAVPPDDTPAPWQRAWHAAST